MSLPPLTVDQVAAAWLDAPPPTVESPISKAGLDENDGKTRQTHIAESPARLGPNLDAKRRVADVFDGNRHYISVRYVPPLAESEAMAEARARLAPRQHFSAESRANSMRPSPPPPVGTSVVGAAPPPFPSLPPSIASVEDRVKKPNDGVVARG